MKTIFSFLLCASLSLNAQDSLQFKNILTGYVADLGGEEVEMQTNIPGIFKALVARCTGKNNSIAWNTAAIPADYKEQSIHIVWWAGLATGNNRRSSSYNLYVNNNSIHFTIHPGAVAPALKLFDSAGTELNFLTQQFNHFGDCFGLMYLKIPVSAALTGHSLHLKIIADNSNRYDDWIMTFQHEAKEEVRFSSRPVLTNARNQELLIEIMHVLPTQKSYIKVNKGDSMPLDIKPGYNRITYSIPEVKTQTKLNCLVTIPSAKTFQKEVVIYPVHERAIYLIPCSHTDIGYSNLQDTVAKQHVEYARQAMKIIDESATYQPEARFKWNIESLWAVHNFMNMATEAEKEKLVDYVKKGHIGLSAGYINLLTGMSGPEEMTHWTAYSDSLKRQYKINFQSLMISDVPGMSWNAVSALAQRKIRYISDGPNYIPHDGFPDYGGRVGATHRAQGDKPFYWVSPSGEDTVLFWQAGKGYSWFQDWNVGRFGTVKAEDSLFNYMTELDEKKYPYDMVQLRYSIINDNCPPDRALPDFVRAWNEKYASPKLIISTVDNMMLTFEKKYRKDIPVFKGDFTPYWEDGVQSTAKEETMARISADRLSQSAIINTIFYANYDAQQFAEAWRNLIMWHEHTWGAWNSISNPDDPYAVKEWKYKQAFAVRADSLSKELLYRSIGHSAGNQFYIINSASFERSDMIILSKEQSAAGNMISDDKGKIYPSQKLSDGRLAFMATGIPALGFRKFILKKGNSNYSSSLKATKNGLENEELKITIDATTGAINHFISKKDQKEYVDNKNFKGFNQYLYVAGMDPSKVQTINHPTITIKENGPLLATIEIQTEAPGTKELTQEISLINGLDEVRITNTIDKLKIRSKESVHFAFPVKTDGLLRYNIGGAVINPETDQLAGANKDYFYIQKWVDVAGLLFMEKDAPLIEQGELIDEMPQKILVGWGGETGEKKWKDSITKSTTFFSYVMNNYWYTNYKADQEGKVSFNYSLKLHKQFDAAYNTRQALNYTQRLLVSSKAPLNKLPFVLKDNDILLTAAKPSIDGKGMVIRLYNSSGTANRLHLQWLTKKNIYLLDESENIIKPFDLNSLWPANSIKTLLIR